MKFFPNYQPGQQTWFSGYATKVIILGIDLGLALLSYFTALMITNNFAMAQAGDYFLLGWAPLILLGLRAIAFVIFKTYLIIIRYIGIRDVRNIFLAVSVSSLAFLIVIMVQPGLLPPKRQMAIVLVDFLLLLVLAGGFRAVMRLGYDGLRARAQSSRLNTVIFGAGEMGALLHDVLKQNVSHDYRVVAFFDDNPKVHRKLLNGVRIFNPGKSFDHVVKQHDIKVAIIAINQLSEERRVAFINSCLERHIKIMKIPATEAWIENDLQLGQLRNIRFEDLLNRPPIDLDKKAINESVRGRCVMVSGCAGSIGSEIVRQLLKYEPQQIIGLDIAETPLAEMSLSLKNAVESGQLLPIIGDVRDRHCMDKLFDRYRPEYVFHAAAYKHVPIMEQFPAEAIKANVLGTRNMAELASEYQAEKFVMISTDKVVNPSNVMGASKRIAEIYVQALNYAEGNRTQFITTRFGNVLGSNGSVIPIFRRQIERRKPVTVTDPEVTRFFMTIPEACQLVLEAGAMGEGGEIYIFDMGEPVKIADLAKRMIQMAGLTPGQDVEIVYTGLRPGEKLYEELLDKGENNKKTHHPKIKKAAVRHSHYHEVSPSIEELIAKAGNGVAPIEIVRQMKRLVPEYASRNSEYVALDKQQELSG